VEGASSRKKKAGKKKLVVNAENSARGMKERAFDEVPLYKVKLRTSNSTLSIQTKG